MRFAFLSVVLIVAGVSYGGDLPSGLPSDNTGSVEPVRELSLRLHWLGVARYTAASGDWEPALCPNGDVLTDEQWSYAPENVLNSNLTMQAAYLLANSSFGRFHIRALLDFMKYDTGPVDDLFIEFSPFRKPKQKRFLSLRVGQFLLPFTHRQTRFPYELLRPAYSQVVRYIFLNGRALREPAIMAFGHLSLLGMRLDYKGFMSNGETQNSLRDSNDEKAFGLRCDITLPKKWLSKLKISNLRAGFGFMDAGAMELGTLYPIQTEFIERQRWCADITVRGRIFGKTYNLYAGYIAGSEDLKWFDTQKSVWILERNRGLEGAVAEFAIWLRQDRKINPARVPVEDLRWRPYGLALVLWWDTFSLTNYRLHQETGSYRRPKINLAAGVVWDIKWFVKLQAFIEYYDFGLYYGGKYIGLDDYGKWRLTLQLGFVTF
ncbi:MAG: hypothetical protein DRP82_03380 [Planctomycetota bacterium]|mgnify:CR=1 FL=1|nr:MAG: hypothetical protein DRP82_03380 [Planctomycetota bacterium]